MWYVGISGCEACNTLLSVQLINAMKLPQYKYICTGGVYKFGKESYYRYICYIFCRMCQNVDNSFLVNIIEFNISVQSNTELRDGNEIYM